MNILKKINPTFAIVVIISALFVFVQWPSSEADEPTPTQTITLLKDFPGGELNFLFEGEVKSIEKMGKTDIDQSEITLSAYQSRHNRLWVSAMQFNYQAGYMSSHQAEEIESRIRQDTDAFKGTLAARETCQLGAYQGIRYILVNENTTFSKDNCLIVANDSIVIASSSFKASQAIIARSKAFFDAVQ